MIECDISSCTFGFESDFKVEIIFNPTLQKNTRANGPGVSTAIYK